MLLFIWIDDGAVVKLILEANSISVICQFEKILKTQSLFLQRYNKTK